jgi:tetratricopeptide (TPR) repeat protein
MGAGGPAAEDAMSVLENLEKLLGGPRDNALLRYSLGNECLKRGETERAAAYYRAALEKDGSYSAAWKMLGKALSEAQRPREALEAWRRGIEVAEGRGDKQAAKEMAVFARRAEKALGAGG